uniref:Uncharacterized protein n=1 Tax=Aegilops tauschii subsp. strangulata TaxID=200361 RepID=A0A453JRN4_AEGTS
RSSFFVQHICVHANMQKLKICKCTSEDFPVQFFNFSVFFWVLRNLGTYMYLHTLDLADLRLITQFFLCTDLQACYLLFVSRPINLFLFHEGCNKHQHADLWVVFQKKELKED